MTALFPTDAPRPLGKSGLFVFPVAWGMWRTTGDVASSVAKVKAARDAGITLFDTADVYGQDGGHAFGTAESLLGEVLRAEPSWRKEMVIAT